MGGQASGDLVELPVLGNTEAEADAPKLWFCEPSEESTAAGTCATGHTRATISSVSPTIWVSQERTAAL